MLECSSKKKIFSNLFPYQSVDLLDLLHGGLGGERVLEDGVLVERVLLRHRLARVLRVAQQPQGLWPVELGLEALGDVALAGRAREGLGGLLRLFLGVLGGCACKSARTRSSGLQCQAGRPTAQAAGGSELRRRSERLRVVPMVFCVHVVGLSYEPEFVTSSDNAIINPASWRRAVSARPSSLAAACGRSRRGRHRRRREGSPSPRGQLRRRPTRCRGGSHHRPSVPTS